MLPRPSHLVPRIRVLSISTQPRRPRLSMAGEEAFWGYLFIAPVALGLTTFYLLPALASLGMAFTRWPGLGEPSFVGLRNFGDLAQDQVFRRSLLNTTLYTLSAVPLSIALATVLAVLLNQPIRGRTTYRTLYFIPVITMPIAVGVVWQWLYNSQFGLVNHVLSLVGLPQPAWLVDERTALLSIVFVGVWMSIGYNTVILLAGLQSIPTAQYEAASLDGAGPLAKFFHITLPLLTPSLFFVLVISLIHALQVFDLVFVMTGGESSLLEATRTIVFSVWEQGFKFFNMGYAAAQAWVLFLVIFSLTVGQFYVQRKWVHYQ